MISKSIKVPSLKQIKTLPNVDDGTARVIRAVMLAYPPLSSAHDEKGALEVLDFVYPRVGGLDCMTLKDKRGNVWRIEYLNSGDSYGQTILYMRVKGGQAKYVIGAWGDYAEKWKDVTQDEAGYAAW